MALKIGLLLAVALLQLLHHSSSAPNTGEDYYGIYLGPLNNASYGISGEVWLANATAIQITNFNVEKQQSEQDLSFVFSTSTEVEAVKSLYKVVTASNGVEYTVPIKKLLDKGVHKERLVVVLNKKSVKAWNYFGVASGKSWKYLAAVKLDKEAPKPYCCLTNPQQPKRGIIGSLYRSNTGPISVVDSKTLILHEFSLDGTKAPDGWIFAGNGEVQRNNGRKAMVVGRDTPTRQCSLRKHYQGDTDLTVQLNKGQTVYTIDFISIFCYQYDVNFGHLNVNLHPAQNPVPAFIPPVNRNLDQIQVDGGDDDSTCPLTE